MQISYVGYKTRETAISPNVRVRLEPDAQAVEAVVVTGMTKTDKRLFTGAADQLVADDVKLSGMGDISRGLEGRSAGVSVQNVSGTFGTAPKIRVRGATSIYGDSKPLWVVDGVIMEDVQDISAEDLSSGDATTLIGSAIAGLNPEDIESFNILKDGSATSIYGARAMAGVIVVTTKKGRPGVSRVNYTGEFTYRMIPSYSNFNLMNSQDQMSVYQEMAYKGWLGNSRVTNASASGIYGKMYALINSGAMQQGSAEQVAFLQAAERRNTDWFKELFQPTVMHSHSVSITSGTEKIVLLRLCQRPVRSGLDKAERSRTLHCQSQRFVQNLGRPFIQYDHQRVVPQAESSRDSRLHDRLRDRRGETRLRHQSLFVCAEHFARARSQ